MRSSSPPGPGTPAGGPALAGPRLFVYFDDDCGFCARCCRMLERADRRHALTFIGAHDVMQHRHDLSGFDLEKSIVAIEAASGRAAVRARAAAMILRVLPRPYSWLRWVGVPPFTAVSDRVYDLVARHRGRLSRALGEPECVAPLRRDATTETQKPCA